MSTKGNKPYFIYPLLNKKIILAMSEFTNPGKALFLLGYLLGWRAQASITLSNILSKTDMQQLPSFRWNAKMIGKNGEIRFFAASLAVVQTLGFEISINGNLTPQEFKENCALKAKMLAEGKPPAGCRILPPQALNEKNIENHRFALMAQSIGTWQSRSLFEPGEIIKGTSISALSIEKLFELILFVLAEVGIDSKDQEFIPNDGSESILNNIKQTLRNALGEIPSFDDAITVGSTNNLLPLEDGLGYNRSTPVDLTPKVFTEFKSDPLYAFALEKASMDSKRVKGIAAPKKAPTSKFNTPTSAQASRKTPNSVSKAGIKSKRRRNK